MESSRTRVALIEIYAIKKCLQTGQIQLNPSVAETKKQELVI